MHDHIFIGTMTTAAASVDFELDEFFHSQSNLDAFHEKKVADAVVFQMFDTQPNDVEDEPMHMQ